MAGYRHSTLLKMAENNRALDRETIVEKGTSVDDAVPIGALRRRHSVYATLIDFDGGVPVFCGEQLVLVYPGQEKQLRLEKHPRDLPSPSWRALDILAREPEAKLRRQYAVVACHPYSLDWVDNAQFKPAGTHSTNWIERDVQKRKAIEHPAGHIAYVSDNLPYDLFETRDNILTASLVNPNRSEPGVATGHRHDTWSGLYTSGKIKRNHGQNDSDKNEEPVEETWVFGVCPDIKGCFNSLKEIGVQSDIYKKTIDGTLLEETNLGDSVRHMFSITPNARDLALAVLDASIAKALAGPVYHANMWFENEKRPVFDLVKEIYQYHLYEMVRRERYDSRAKKVLPSKMPRPTKVATHFPYWLCLLEEEVAQYVHAVEDRDSNDAEMSRERLQSLLLENLNRDLQNRNEKIRFRGVVSISALRRIVPLEDLPISRLVEMQKRDPEKSIRLAAKLAFQIVYSW